MKKKNGDNGNRCEKNWSKNDADKITCSSKSLR